MKKNYVNVSPIVMGLEEYDDYKYHLRKFVEVMAKQGDRLADRNDPVTHRELERLAVYIRLMSKADTVRFWARWRNDRVCRYAYQIAKEFGLSIEFDEPESDSREDDAL